MRMPQKRFVIVCDFSQAENHSEDYPSRCTNKGDYCRLEKSRKWEFFSVHVFLCVHFSLSGK